MQATCTLTPPPHFGHTHTQCTWELGTEQTQQQTHKQHSTQHTTRKSPRCRASATHLRMHTTTQCKPSRHLALAHMRARMHACTHRHPPTHTHMHMHTHAQARAQAMALAYEHAPGQHRTARQEQSKKSGQRKRLRSCRAALHVFSVCQRVRNVMRSQCRHIPSPDLNKSKGEFVLFTHQSHLFSVAVGCNHLTTHTQKTCV